MNGGLQNPIVLAVSIVVLACWGLIAWSGFRPEGRFSQKPRDRAVRAAGAGIIFLFGLAGMVLELSRC